MSFDRSILATIGLPVTVGIVAGAMSRMAAGNGMGFYFAGLALAGILIPLVVARTKTLREAMCVTIAAAGGVALVWLGFVFNSNVTLGQWLSASIVLIATSLAIAGLTLALRRVLGPDIAAAFAVILFLAWLACPIWSASLSASLAAAHPLLALNHIFINDGIWTQQRLMYDLTSLGQDVPYALARTIAACAFAHVIIALATSWLAVMRARPAASVPRLPAESPAP